MLDLINQKNDGVKNNEKPEIYGKASINHVKPTVVRNSSVRQDLTKGNKTIYARSPRLNTALQPLLKDLSGQANLTLSKGGTKKAPDIQFKNRR